MGKDNKGSDNLHERISNRKPHSFLHEQVKRKPEIVDALLVDNSVLEKNYKENKEKWLKAHHDAYTFLDNNRVLKGELKQSKKKAEEAVQDAYTFGFEGLKKDNIIFKEFFEQVREKILPNLVSQLKKLDKLDENIKKKIKYEDIKKYIDIIPTLLNEAPYWSGMAEKIKETGENICKISFEMSQSNRNNIDEDVYNSLIALEIAGNNLADLYTNITDPKNSNWKLIDELKKQNNHYAKSYYEQLKITNHYRKMNDDLSVYRNLYLKQLEKENLECQKGPVVNLMTFLTSRFTLKNQRNGYFTDNFVSRFSHFITMKFDSFDSLIEYIISDENPYRISMTQALFKKAIDFPVKNQIMIIEKIDSFSRSDSPVDVNFGKNYVANINNQEIAMQLVAHKNRFIREYLLYNKQLPKLFMVTKILPILKKDNEKLIRDQANKLSEELSEEGLKLHI